MNKVLNRPMFRKEALKKGHLKPIKANIGTLVGQPYSPPGVPAVLQDKVDSYPLTHKDLAHQKQQDFKTL